MTPMMSQYKHVGACKEKEGREKGRTGTGAVRDVVRQRGTKAKMNVSTENIHFVD